MSIGGGTPNHWYLYAMIVFEACERGSHDELEIPRVQSTLACESSTAAIRSLNGRVKLVGARVSIKSIHLKWEQPGGNRRVVRHGS